MSKLIKRQLNRIEEIEKKTFWSLFIILLFLFISYGILINKTILNGKYSQNISMSIEKLSQDLNELEFKYLEAKNNITFDLAVSKGFVAVSDQKFVDKGSVERTLSLITNEK